MSCRLKYNFSDTSTIKQYLTPALLNSQKFSPIISEVVYKNNKNRRQIIEAICMKNEQSIMYKIAFNSGTNMLNIFNY